MCAYGRTTRTEDYKNIKQAQNAPAKMVICFVELSHQRNIYVYIFLLIIARNCKKRNAKSANTHKIIKNFSAAKHKEKTRISLLLLVPMFNIVCYILSNDQNKQVWR